MLAPGVENGDHAGLGTKVSWIGGDDPHRLGCGLDQDVVHDRLVLEIGFEALYMNGSPTFGANPVTDYLTAIIWGLSADVAGRTL